MAEKNKEISSYELAKREWDFQISRSYKSLRLWQMTAVSLAFISIFVVVSTVNHLTKPKLVPYVVTVTEEGTVNFLGVIQNQRITITDAMIRNSLINFITNLRTVSSDPVVLRTNLFRVYYFATQNAQRQISEMIERTNPFLRSTNGERVDINFNLFEKMGNNTWRAEWTEDVREQGELKRQVRMSGIFTFTIQLPEDPIHAENNPLGIFFTEFNLAERR